ncbi:diguanylate cyclase [Desulfurivibrio sp. D14AmB]|uniref:GGDEF domain-containing protein n=1 Tax=Desulfurivibrio sp. D14AmB TaxID=3374370 RepID=UPI00376F0804
MNAAKPRRRRVRRPGFILGNGLIMLLLLAAVAYGYFGAVLQQAQQAQRGIQGLNHLEHIRAIIEPMQESRGLLTMGQQADPALTGPRLAGRLAAVDQAFALFLEYLAEEQDPLGLAQESGVRLQEWRRLRTTQDYSAPEQVFAAFTAQIGPLLALHRRAITTSGLDLDPVADTYNLVQILDLLLELALEPNGQIRALYATLLSTPAGNQHLGDRIFGRALLLDIVSTRLEHHAAMVLQARPDLTGSLAELSLTIRPTIVQIRDLLAAYSPTGATTPADAQNFFTAATEVITAGYQLYDNALAAARDSLEQRRAQAQTTLRRAVPLFLLLGLGTLALVGWGLTAWRQHQRDTEDLHRQSRFQALVAETSTRFLQTGAGSIDGAISEMLRAVGEFFAVDRAYLFRYTSDGQQLNNTHEWCAPGVPPQRELLQEIPTAEFPWWQQRMREQFQAGRIFSIPDVDQLPEEAAAERKMLSEQGIRSLCTMPVAVNQQLVGFVGLDYLRLHACDEEQTGHRLIMIANLISAGLEREALERELTVNAITDGLTGLYNRRHFFTSLTTQIKEYRRTHKPFALAIFDLDHFKELNDTHGHLVGDCVLKEFATLLREGFRAFDIVARYGGEEFIVMLIDSDREAAAAIAQRMLDTTRRHHFECHGESLRITISGGVVDVTEITAEKLTPEALVDQADQRLYQAKEAGRDQVIWQEAR